MTETAGRSGAELAARYLDTRRTTERLVAPLSAEDMMVQSMSDASPAKWHLAHTSWFFETFLLTPHLPAYQPLEPQYCFLFNSYYKQVGLHPNRALRGAFSRPSLEQVRRYREHVDAAMLRLLQSTANPELLLLTELGINHEQQHQELIVTDIKHALWSNPLRPAYVEGVARVVDPGAPAGDPRHTNCLGGSPTLVSPGEACPEAERGGETGWEIFAGGEYEIGHAGGEFAFDNESPRHRVRLEPFRLGTRLATNREYLEFMDDGGYRRPEWWLSDGWDQVCAAGWQAPLYWEQQDNVWLAFTSAGMRPVAPDEPVCHVSYYEADAFARWAGARLPREQEWEMAAESSVSGRQPSGKPNLLEAGRFHPTPAPPASGLQQMFGDVWEWTSSPYIAYPGYRPAAGALGEYNGKFMCNQMVLRGGSCATPAPHIRASYRNFFPPHARWQFMGIRLANDCS